MSAARMAAASLARVRSMGPCETPQITIDT